MEITQTTIEVIKPGDGVNFPSAGDIVTLHYIGTLTDGKVFDSTRDRNSPLTMRIGVGQVIIGLDNAILLMSLGARCRLEIPAHDAYGSRGAGTAIPPNAALIYDVELLGIKQ
ncbi:FKBP-type peptidyl-prolyl cis-trans isomerase [Pseudomonas sp. S49]|uniref:FKBP-type peptidyl-prolyl cis-trans isomerase n=1 Tax=Pseudomonas sp. S49 TaxID=1573720 RepID=UPI00132ECCFB|nr:FKBP-type peptidyl-prolyl cis-trans isomerase [Pseudomonas sp. S49]QHF50827.1 peptidylprolyl isomerase [Pseudomonas sp. S49]